MMQLHYDPEYITCRHNKSLQLCYYSLYVPLLYILCANKDGNLLPDNQIIIFFFSFQYTVLNLIIVQAHFT